MSDPAADWALFVLALVLAALVIFNGGCGGRQRPVPKREGLTPPTYATARSCGLRASATGPNLSA